MLLTGMLYLTILAEITFIFAHEISTKLLFELIEKFVECRLIHILTVVAGMSVAHLSTFTISILVIFPTCSTCVSVEIGIRETLNTNKGVL